MATTRPEVSETEAVNPDLPGPISASPPDVPEPGPRRPEWFRRAGVWIRKPPHVVGILVVAGLLAIQLRDLFAHGKVMMPDLYIGAPATPGYDWLEAYFWRWTPPYLGSESALPLYFGIEGVLTRMGVLGAAVQAILIVPLAALSGLVIWQLAERHTDHAWIPLLAPTIYLLGPNLFELLFDGSSDFFLYALLPLLAWLTMGIIEAPSWRRGVALGIVIGLNCAFEPFAPLLSLPFVFVLAGSLLLLRSVSRSSLFSAGLIVMAYAIGILLNAPYYLGNFGYLTTSGIAGAFQAEAPVVMTTYGWSGPVNLLSLLGGSLYPRYAAFYPAWAAALLLLVPAAAAAALIAPRGSKSRHLRIAMGVEVLVSVAWVTATRTGLTLGVFETIPYLLVFNYPQTFYLSLGFAFAILATLTVDDLARIAGQPLDGPAEPAPVKRVRYPKSFEPANLRRFARRFAWLLVTVALIIALVAPASFYLSGGDMRIDAAPSAAGFPPAWGAHEPPSFADIGRFLAAHGGDRTARLLLLPAAAFAGGGTLPGYSMNLFNQPEFTGEYTGPFFAAEASQEYATSVLNYLVSNRTDRIGLPLGVASVRWVIVDRELNFTGPPRWYLGSMIGDPASFRVLLNQQRDLRIAFEDERITVYENLDYRPYLQDYSGVVLVERGQPGNVPAREVYEWPLDPNNWTTPLSPGPLQDVSPIRGGTANTVDGYNVSGMGGTGTSTIRFLPDASGSSISSTSSRFDTDGVYLTSVAVPITDQEYVIQYELDYEGPAAHQGGFLFVSGSDARLNFLWQTEYCCAGEVGRRSLRMTVDPFLEDPRTAFIQLSVVFPYRFGSAPDVSMTISNLTLGVTPRPAPSDTLAPLLLPQLPRSYQGSGDAAILTRDLSASDWVRVNGSATPMGRLCLGTCPVPASGTMDQLVFAYNALAFPPAASPIARNPEAVSGAVLDITGPASANLTLSGSPFRTLYVRARGNGTVTLGSPSGLSHALAVTNASFAWYMWSLTNPAADRSLQVDVSGFVSLDAFLLTDSVANATAGTARGEVPFNQTSPVQYTGIVPGSPGILVLAQGYSPAWELQIDGQRVTPLPALGWANGFVLPSGTLAAGGVAFELTFTHQAEQQTLIAVQLIAAAVSGIALAWPWWRRLARRVRFHRMPGGEGRA